MPNDRLEPRTTDAYQTPKIVALTSIAISLKRIADALEKGTVLPRAVNTDLGFHR